MFLIPLTLSASVNSAKTNLPKTGPKPDKRQSVGAEVHGGPQIS